MLKIPVRFKKLLEKDTRMFAIVQETVAEYSDLLKMNKLIFFPEYTDHGIDHVNAVLAFSESVITKATYSILGKSPKSIGVYILAVILHDLGMHLTIDGFNSLLNGKSDDLRVARLDRKTWRQLWEDYLDEARRFGDREKMNILGNKDWNFKVPDFDHEGELTLDDHRLVGEFIRRYHPRIAHEVALGGFPTATEYISFAGKLESDLKDIAGLLARSHGMEIRDTFSYIKERFPTMETRPYGIELKFFMVVLRIADYCQIDAQRVPAISLRIRSLRSPISRDEHYKHEDIPYSQYSDTDPETIVFFSKPRNSLIFLKIGETLTDLQHELDKSWAILGQVYGKEKQEDQPEIRIRRVLSNIDDVESIAKDLAFVPEKIRFTINSDVSKLLIGPLYGNDPTYGVRELIQNAVDACRERAMLEGEEYKGQVVVSFTYRNQQAFISIEDNGIGMSPDTIKNYYLSVGSSLRVSPSWRRQYLNAEGRSNVERTGKFGIGILAAFLLGSEIQVRTRNMASEDSFAFTARLESEQLEIARTTGGQIGTRIEIPINEQIIELLKSSKIRFDKWYTQSNPIIKFKDELKEYGHMGYGGHAPGFTDNLPDGWYILPQTEFNKIMWSFLRPDVSDDDGKFERLIGSRKLHSEYVNDETVLTCNGILIPGAEQFSIEAKPFISVFDFDGKLPVNLSRNGLDGELSFKDSLIKDMKNSLIARLLSFKVDYPLSKPDVNIRGSRTFYHPMFGRFSILFGKSGFILRDNYFTKRNIQSNVVQFSMLGYRFPEAFDCKDAFVCLEGDQRDFSFWLRRNVQKMLVREDVMEEARQKLLRESRTFYGDPLKDSLRYFEYMCLDEQTIALSKGICPFSTDDLRPFSGSCEMIVVSDMEEYNRINEATIVDDDTIASLKYYLNDQSLIPYDMKERRAMFPLAFRELRHLF